MAPWLSTSEPGKVNLIEGPGSVSFLLDEHRRCRKLCFGDLAANDSAEKVGSGTRRGSRVAPPQMLPRRSGPGGRACAKSGDWPTHGCRGARTGGLPNCRDRVGVPQVEGAPLFKALRCLIADAALKSLQTI